MESWPGNRDEQANILFRLPTKAFLGLKSVSKDWCNFISDLMSESSFIRQHSKRKEPTSGFFYQERFKWHDDDIKFVSYITAGKEGVQAHRRVFEFLPEYIVVQASSYGLICARSCFGSQHQLIYICNPINKEWISLPFPQFDTKSSLALAFDPFSDVKDDATNFKVVQVYEADTEMNNSLFVFNVYSSENKTWRMSVEICHRSQKLFKNKGIFVAGYLYWLTDGDQILMFNPETELSLLIAVPLPQAEYRSIPQMCLGEYKGKLCYVVVSVDGLVLWVLEDMFTSVWKLEHSVALQLLELKHQSFPDNTFRRIQNPMVPWIDPLIVTDGQLFMRVSEDIFLYDFNTGDMKMPCNLSMLGFNYACSPLVLPYTASLVPLRNV